MVGGAIATVIALSCMAFGAKLSQPTNNLPNPYLSIADWVKMPDDRRWGLTAGVDIAPDGKSVGAVDRCGTNTCVGSNLDPVLKFDASGKLVKSFGKGMFAFPHGIYVDPDQNIDLFDRDGKLLDSWDHFSRPSGIYIDSNDNMYVCDSESGSASEAYQDWTLIDDAEVNPKCMMRQS
jgi:hypothetical protein